jgi:hypothetical protein
MLCLILIALFLESGFRFFSLADALFYLPLNSGFRFFLLLLKPGFGLAAAQLDLFHALFVALFGEALILCDSLL